MRLILTTIAAAGMAAPLAAQTPTVAADIVPAAERCEVLPIGGAGSAPGVNGTLSIAGAEGARVVRLNGRPVQKLGRDVASASVHAACRTGTTDYYLIGLAAPSRDPSCPLRYQALEIAGGTSPRFSQRFGSCTDGATATLSGGAFLVTMPAGPGNPANLSYRYQRGQIVPVVAQPVVVARTERRRGRAPYTLAAWTAPPACAIVARRTPLRSEAVSADILLADFSRDWPLDWRSRGRLRDQPFNSSALRAVVTDLACLSALPGGERIVTRAARPLFESGRHGKAAFEQLDEVARGAAVDGGIRAAARSFHAMMRYEVDQEPFWR